MQRPLSPLKLALRLALLILLALFIGAVSVKAQLVTPRTVPVFQDEQFNIAPSSRPGLGSALIALDDTLGDPFTNPAKAVRLRGVSVAAAPFLHDISGERGGGSTLPVALFAGAGGWAGAVLAAYQNLDRAGPAFNRPVSERSSSNQYLGGVLARRVGSVSVGVGVSHASLGAVDGVDLLYAGSDRIDQDGSVTEYRIGLLKEWVPGHAFELLGIHSRTDMVHDVHFTTWTWDPVLQKSLVTERQDHNLDQTRIWGLHSRYTRPVGSDGWRVGGLVTANRLSHPKIPNYVLQSIPRDPGTTYGYDIGIGAARIAGRSSFFADLVAEPMTSETWADLARDTTDVTGAVLPAGAKTIENSFDFHNSKARVGAGYAFPVSADSSSTVGLDVGLAVYTIGYGLRQTNNIARTTREQAERWAEVSQSLGIRFHSRDFELSYAFRRTCGNRGCGREDRSVVVFGPVVDVAAPGGIIAAPSAPLFLESGTETSHRFMVAVPIH
jgi:hypothetical protein